MDKLKEFEQAVVAYYASIREDEVSIADPSVSGSIQGRLWGIIVNAGLENQLDYAIHQYKTLTLRKE